VTQEFLNHTEHLFSPLDFIEDYVLFQVFLYSDLSDKTSVKIEEKRNIFRIGNLIDIRKNIHIRDFQRTKYLLLVSVV